MDTTYIFATCIFLPSMHITVDPAELSFHPHMESIYGGSRNEIWYI